MKLKKNLNKTNSVNKKKKYFFLFSSLSIAAVSSITLAACGAIDTNLVDKTISKGNGNIFASNYDLSTMTKKAFENDSAQKSYLSSMVNKLLLSWITNLANDGKNISFKKALDAQIKTVNDEFESVRKSSLDNNTDNFPLVFQQNELDANGGTEQAWKDNKMLSWANTYFQGKVFEKDFLTILDSSNNPIVTPSEQMIIDAINNTNGYSFGFSKDAYNPTIAKNNLLDPIFANFQKFVFDEWVQKENPFVVNMSLWKYGTPKDGINSVYLPKVSSDETTASPGTYAFPYFSNDASATNENGGTVDKFVKFVTDAVTTSGYVTNTTLGLRDIPKMYTDDSSTFILAKNSSIYNDLYIEFAAASSYLLYKREGSATAGLTNIDTDLSVGTISTTKGATDIITGNFIKNSSVNNRDIKLANSLAKEIVNSSGEFASLVSGTNEVYITDTITTTSTGLDKFIFLRNEAGVHAIAIDGKLHLNTATNLEQYKQKAADIVLYHYFLNKNGYSDFQIDVKSEITNFLNNNFAYLVWKYATDTTIPSDLQLFNPIAEFGSATVGFINLLNTYLFEISKYSKPFEYQDKMFSAKSGFANNYGILAKNNGLAAPWVYSYIANSTNFELAKTATIVNDPFATSGSQKAFFDAINNFVDQLNLAPLQSSFEGFKYSQYILTNNYFINVLLNSYGSDGNSIGNGVKNDILTYYLSNNVDLSTLEFKNSIWTSSTFATSAASNLNNAMVNFFYNSNFNSATDRWSKYTKDSTSTISYTNLNEYRKQLWLDSNRVNTSAASDSYLSLYTLMSTVNYLLENDGREFLNYLKTKINIGDDAFIGWSQVNNKALNTTAATSGSVLDVTNTSLSKNMNNAYMSSYYGANPSEATAITNNVLTSSNPIFQNDSNYYNYVANTVGYLGLQTSSSNSFPSIIANQLFTTPTSAAVKNKGLLYSYESRTALVDRINGFNLVSDLENLARSLYTKIGTFSIDSVINASNLVDKKTAFLTIVNNTSIITDEMFEPRTGYISTDTDLTKKDSSLIANPSSANLEYATKVIQLNSNDISSLTNLDSAFAKLTGITETQKSEIFFNLVVQAALETTQQENAVNSIISSRRVEVYDVRLNNQLGPRWASNWK